MAPPQLARDTPRLDVAQPIEINIGPVPRYEFGTAVFHSLNGPRGQRADVKIPLLGHVGFEHDGLGFFVMRHGVDDRLDLVEQTECFKVRHNRLARHKTIQPAINLGHRIVQRRVLVQDIDQRQVVPPADLEIVEVVAGGDLHRAGALFGVGILVGDDRDQPACQRQAHQFAHQGLVAFVVRMDGHGGVAQHGFWPCGGHDDEPLGIIRQRVFDVPEIAFELDTLDFQVADRCLQPRIPVHQPLILIDEVLAIKLYKHFQNGPRQPLVHGEALARPVRRGAKPAQLLADGSAGLLLPFPDRFQELLAAHGHAALLALGQLALDDELGGDPGMVHAGLPEDIFAPHPLETGQRILQRVVQGMPNVEAPRDIGRRDDDAKRLSARLAACPEST